MESDIVFIVQARLGSKRLPGKMLMPFYEQKSILEILIQKLKFHFPQIQIILATSTNSQDDKLETVALEQNITCYRGDEENVLLRFIEAAIFFNKTKIIRICADNPFLSILYMKKLIFSIENESTTFDYISFLVNNKPSIKSHYGFWAEYVSLDALMRIKDSTSDYFYFEHVTNFIYENPSLFSIKLIPVDNNIEINNFIRLTIDTNDDFLLTSEIFRSITENINFTNVDVYDIITYLNQSNIDYRSKMNEQMLKNKK